MATIVARLQIRGDTAANWASVNPVLLSHEEGYETDTGRRKVGNGTVGWNALPYDGVVTSADKAKLDAATASPTSTTLVMRDAAGRSQVISPIAGNDIANKTYVDSAVSGLPAVTKLLPAFDIEGRVDGNILLYDVQSSGSERYLNNTVIQRWIPSSGLVSISQQRTNTIDGGNGVAFAFIGTASVSTPDITLSPLPASLTFSAYLLRSAAESVQVRFDILWKTSAGATISTTTGASFSPAATMTLYSTTASVPASAGRAVLIISATSGTGTVYADRIVARSSSTPTYKAPSSETIRLVPVFEDTFASFDAATWTKGTSAASFDNYGIEEWDEALVTVSGGNLVLTADFRTPLWFSGLVRSKGLKFWKYGYFETRMRFTSAPGMWPAFTLYPEHDSYGLWARSGGINVMEFVSSDPTRIWGSVNTADPADPNFSTNTFTIRTAATKSSSVTTASSWAGSTFHTYGLFWTRLPDGRIFLQHYVDEIPYGTHWTGDWTTPYGGTAGSPFDAYFYIQLNLALGGSWAGAPNSVTTHQATVEVDWVKVWQAP